jgi:hypothetical protein
LVKGSILLEGQIWQPPIKFAEKLESVFENKGDLHLNPVLGDSTAIVNQDFLIFDPGAGDMFESFVGAGNPGFNGFIETEWRRGF